MQPKDWGCYKDVVVFLGCQEKKNAYTSTAMSCVFESPSEKVFRVVSTEKLVYPTRDSWDPRMFGLLFSSNPFAIFAKVRKGGKKHDLIYGVRAYLAIIQLPMFEAENGIFNFSTIKNLNPPFFRDFTDQMLLTQNHHHIPYTVYLQNNIILLSPKSGGDMAK